MPLVLDRPPRHHLEVARQRFCLRAAVGLDDGDDDIVTGAFSLQTFLEHLKRLAHAWRGAKEHLEFAAPFALRGAKQGLGRRPEAGGGAIVHC